MSTLKEDLVIAETLRNQSMILKLSVDGALSNMQFCTGLLHSLNLVEGIKRSIDTVAEQLNHAVELLEQEAEAEHSWLQGDWK